MRTRSDIDWAIANLADAQWGVLARRQLLERGGSRDAVGRRVRSGRLRVLHHGVYAVGHRALREEAIWLAAVLAGGPDAVLSHASAADLWDLRASAAARVDVTAPGGSARRRPGLRFHRNAVAGEERTVHERIPVTTPARTLLDLAATLPRRSVERALERAETLRIFDLRALRGVCEAHRARPGAPLLTALLDAGAGEQAPTRSELEERFLTLCDAHGVPRPRLNSRVAGLEVDFHWPGRRLVIEVDGYAYHRSRAAFERDRERDAILAAAGRRVLRFSARQIAERPDEVLRALRVPR